MFAGTGQYPPAFASTSVEEVNPTGLLGFTVVYPAGKAGIVTASKSSDSKHGPVIKISSTARPVPQAPSSL